MSSQPSPTSARQIIWPSVITVISAAILIGAEVFGAAFAGGWALAILFGLDDTGAHILQAVLFGLSCLRLLFRRFDVIEADHMPYMPLFTLRFVPIRSAPLISRMEHRGKSACNLSITGTAGSSGSATAKMISYSG